MSVVVADARARFGEAVVRRLGSAHVRGAAVGERRGRGRGQDRAAVVARRREGIVGGNKVRAFFCRDVGIFVCNSGRVWAMTRFGVQGRVVLPVRVPCDEGADDAAGDDVSGVMSVIHRPGNTDQGSRSDGNEEDPRLDRVASLVQDVHLAGEEQGEVDHTAPSKRGVARGEGTEAIVEEVRPRTDAP